MSTATNDLDKKYSEFLKELTFLLESRSETVLAERAMYEADSKQPKAKRLWVNHKELMLSCRARAEEINGCLRRIVRLTAKHGIQA